MSNEDYEDMLDDVEDQIDYGEESQDLQDQQVDSYGVYPTTKEKSDIYNWFWKVVKLNEPHKAVKTGNLNNVEIGLNSVSVRDALNLAHLGDIFHHRKFANYFQNIAQITSATSMARQGWFMDLSISQKKVRERSRKPSSSTTDKWRLFGKKQTTPIQ